MTQAMSRRALQARATRLDILSAARRLFAERGYARTSVRDIAAAAHVSPQTVYDSIGSKRAVVAGLNDLIDAEAGIASIVGPVMQAGDAAAICALPARITTAIVGSCGDIVRTLVSGADVEPDLAGVLAEGRRRHHEGALRVAGLLAGRDALRADLTPAQAGDLLAVATDAEYALILMDRYQWPASRTEQWMAEVSRRAVLPPEVAT